MDHRHSEKTDYAIVRAAIEYLSGHAKEQPDLDAIAKALGQGPFALQKLFKRWAGISPKSFLQALTLDHAKNMLRDASSILDASLEVGLSGPSRLHDLFVSHEAMSPGVYKARGAGVTISWAFHPCPFGLALLMVTEHGLAGLAFCDEGNEAASFDDMAGRWPNADYVQDSIKTAPYMARIFNREEWRPDQPLRVVFIGTDFEVRVWETLLKIPFGKATTMATLLCISISPREPPVRLGRRLARTRFLLLFPAIGCWGKRGNFVDIIGD